MDMEPTTPVIGKKLWKIVRIVFLMLRKGISKSKLMIDLHTLLKSGKIVRKALSNLMLHHHYSAMTCRPHDDVHLSYYSPRGYEFSCTNTPDVSSFRRRSQHNHTKRRHQNHQADDFFVIQKVYDILNNNEVSQSSPLSLSGFGSSPMVRQLRVTDSPFPLKDEKEDTQVDKLAEEFINKFYMDLKLQKNRAALESPSPYHLWDT